MSDTITYLYVWRAQATGTNSSVETHDFEPVGDALRVDGGNPDDGMNQFGFLSTGANLPNIMDATDSPLNLHLFQDISIQYVNQADTAYEPLINQPCFLEFDVWEPSVTVENTYENVKRVRLMGKMTYFSAGSNATNGYQSDGVIHLQMAYGIQVKQPQQKPLTYDAIDLAVNNKQPVHDMGSFSQRVTNIASSLNPSLPITNRPGNYMTEISFP